MELAASFTNVIVTLSGPDAFPFVDYIDVLEYFRAVEGSLLVVAALNNQRKFTWKNAWRQL